jgi:ABC-type dipeptide/oligopeptide/nickel transport system permease subunit
MSARRAWIDFQLKRARNFLREFRKSKRAITGVAILIFYTIFALAAPILTSYDPIRTQYLAGVSAAPVWWKYLPGGSTLSQNFQVAQSSLFTHPNDFQTQGWNTSSTPGTNLSVRFNSSDTGLSSAGNFPPGSEQITYSRQANSPLPPSPGAVETISKAFYWPYNGPPNKFNGSLVVFVNSMQGVRAIALTTFITNGAIEMPLSNQTITINSVGTRVVPPEDSNDKPVRLFFGVSTIDPAIIAFSGSGNYSYGFKITIPDTNLSNNVNVNISFNNLNLTMKGTSWGLLGTDQNGRDIFTQLAWGTRVSLTVGLVASFLGVVIGLVVGLLAGFLGKIVDEVLMRFTDMVLVLPGLPLLIVLAALLGPSIWNIIIILGFLGWAGFARVIRSQVLSLRERSFIEASKAAGSGTGHIIVRHIFPNVLGLTYVSLALAVPTAIVSEASLAFLGLADPNVISWGTMLNDVENNAAITSWWWILPPGLSIAILSLSFVLLGYALDELLNPRLRMRR